MSNQKIEVNLLVIGDSGVGKTSLVERFTKNTFSSSISPTIGLEYDVKAELENVKIWDVAGRERFQPRNNPYITDKDAVCIVLTDKTRTQFKTYYAKAKEHAPNALIYVIFNKNDEDNLASHEQSARKSTIAGLSDSSDSDDIYHRIFFCSAKTGENVDNAFNTMIDVVRNAKQAILKDKQPIAKSHKSINSSSNDYQFLPQSSTPLKFGNPSPTSLKDDKTFASTHKNWIIFNIVLAIVIGITVGALLASGFGIPALIVAGVSVAMLLAGDGLYIFAATRPDTHSPDNDSEDLSETDSDKNSSGFESDSENTKKQKPTPEPIIDGPFKLQIKTDTDKGKVSITINPNDTIADLKIILEGLTGVPFETQMIALDGDKPSRSLKSAENYSKIKDLLEYIPGAVFRLAICHSIESQKLLPLTVAYPNDTQTVYSNPEKETVDTFKKKCAGIMGIPILEQRLFVDNMRMEAGPLSLSGRSKISLAHIQPSKDITEEYPVESHFESYEDTPPNYTSAISQNNPASGRNVNVTIKDLTGDSEQIQVNPDEDTVDTLKKNTNFLPQNLN